LKNKAKAKAEANGVKRYSMKKEQLRRSGIFIEKEIPHYPRKQIEKEAMKYKKE